MGKIHHDSCPGRPQLLHAYPNHRALGQRLVRHPELRQNSVSLIKRPIVMHVAANFLFNRSKHEILKTVFADDRGLVWPGVRKRRRQF